ncbi:MAG: extracellular solute-binding protein family 1 [Actinomycetia bacterium]|nr:extracellular solute-binding protein family 1 [Actinomycetes bacterium]
MRATKAIVAAGAAIGAVLLAAGCSSSSSTSAASGSSGSSSVNWATTTSAQAGGGMSALVAAAEKEGQLNVITLPSNWANYGAIIKAFEAKYKIKITDANPEGSSQDEINAINSLKGRSTAPDVVDVGTSYAVSGDTSGLWAPYEVSTWSDIPASAKQASGDYYADYGGYIAIGYDPSKVKVAPTSFKSLLNPIYKNQVAIDGNPTQTGSAFAAVYAAAIANGGSLSNIAPGVSYFKQLHTAGNYVPVEGTPATVQSGQTPILIWWDYLLASEVQTQDKNFKVVIPSDGTYAGYYDQAISKTAPDPAAARLWEEFLYSSQGQNLFLAGPARPIELSALEAAGTVDKTALAALPAVPAADGGLQLPTTSQLTTATNVVAQQWPSVTG